MIPPTVRTPPARPTPVGSQYWIDEAPRSLSFWEAPGGAALPGSVTIAAPWRVYLEFGRDGRAGFREVFPRGDSGRGGKQVGQSDAEYYATGVQVPLRLPRPSNPALPLRIPKVMVESAEVAIEGLIPPSPARTRRARVGDLATHLMREVVPERWRGLPYAVGTFGYVSPPEPMVWHTAAALRPHEALIDFAHEYAHERRLPLLLARVTAGPLWEKRNALIAAVATRDPEGVACYAWEGRIALG